MKLIGYWIESSLQRNYYPPQEFVGRWDSVVRRMVADYLSRGEVYEVYRGYSWCRFFCEHTMGHGELSDGSYVWPEDLAHYVRDHNVFLPEELVEHIRAGVPRIPKVKWDRSPLDYDFWKQWCREHSDGRCQPRIEVARREWPVEAKEFFALEVAAREAKEGLSKDRCQWAGCTNLALAGRAECALCTLSEGPGPAIMVHAPFDLRDVLGV